MTDERPRRPIAWKILLFLFCAFAITAASFTFWVGAVADRKWAAMEARTQELLAQVRARTAARPVLRGQAIPGNAWDDYALATADIKALQGKDGALYDWIARGPKADRAAVEALLAAHAPALEHLRRGVQRAASQFPYDWEAGWDMKLPDLLASQRLGNLAVCRSRFLREEGKSREAAGLMLDVGQFARDLGYNGVLINEMIALAVYSLVFGEMMELILSDELKEADFEALERGLELLDQSFPPHAYSIAAEPMCCGASLTKGGLAPMLNMTNGEQFLKSWPYAFSTRLMAADAFLSMDQWALRAAEADGKPWAEILAVNSAIELEASKSPNYMVKIAVPGTLGCRRVGREKRAQLRLLRVAARFRATGEVLELDDPFGAKLLHSKSGEALKVWSVGSDGVDAGGQGDWRPQRVQDMVLEVKR